MSEPLTLFVFFERAGSRYSIHRAVLMEGEQTISECDEDANRIDVLPSMIPEIELRSAQEMREFMLESNPERGGRSVVCQVNTTRELWTHGGGDLAGLETRT